MSTVLFILYNGNMQCSRTICLHSLNLTIEIIARFVIINDLIAR